MYITYVYISIILIQHVFLVITLIAYDNWSTRVLPLCILQLHDAGIQETKECSNYRYSNEYNRYGRRIWGQETQTTQILANQDECKRV